MNMADFITELYCKIADALPWFPNPPASYSRLFEQSRVALYVQYGRAWLEECCCPTISPT